MSRARADATIYSHRYVVERALGHGGMATVYLARDTELERPVALKVLAEHLAADDMFRRRFVREAKLAAQVVHPNVVRVYDVGETEQGLPFLVTEYVDGGTLADELHRRSRLPPAEVVALGVEICAGLEAAHGQQLVHRDVKPQNILLGAGGAVKIADFGIARSLSGPHQTEVGTVVGTAAYLAPEQARGEAVTESADIYSVGVVLYEALTGETPFAGLTLAELIANGRPLVTPPSQVVPGVIPAALEDVLMKCLAERPEARPESAAELSSRLQASLDGEPATAVMEAPTRVITPARHRYASLRRGRNLAVLAVVLVVLGGIVWISSSGSGNSPAASTKKHSTSQTAARQTVAVTTPAQALAALRSRVEAAARNGGLDDGPLNDLEHRIDDISSAALAGDKNGAARGISDLEGKLDDLARSGQLTPAASSTIGGALDHVASVLGVSALVTSLEQPAKPPKPHGPKPEKPKHGHDPPGHNKP